MLLSIYTEVHSSFLCNFCIRKFNNMKEDLIPPPIPRIILLIPCHFQCPLFQWQECGIIRSILKGNLEGHWIPGNECLHSTRTLPSFACKPFNISKSPQRACTLTWSQQVTFLKYLAVSNVPGRQHWVTNATVFQARSTSSCQWNYSM